MEKVEVVKKQIVQLLATKEKVTWSEMRENIQCAKATLSKALKQLINEGIVTEEIDRYDRRVRYYSLSKIGVEKALEDILSIRYLFELLSKESTILEKLPENINLEHASKIMSKEIVENVGWLFVISIFNETYNAFIDALSIYSEYTILHLFANFDDDIKQKERELMNIDVKDFLKQVYKELYYIVKMYKIVEAIDDTQIDRLSVDQEAKDFFKVKVKFERERLKRLIERLRSNLLVRNYIQHLLDTLKIDEHEINNYLERLKSLT